MIYREYIEDFWLHWLKVEVLALKPLRNYSMNRDRSGLLLRERVEASQDDWVKPDVAGWWEADREEGAAPVDRLLTPKERQRFTKVLTEMERDGLVQLQRAENRRIAWAKLTPKGHKEAKRCFLPDEE